MIITKQILLNEQERLTKRREQLVADLNGVIGAEQEVTVLLAVLDTPESAVVAVPPEEKKAP